jgi:thiol-disulfide isomerase/thioredoxin
MIISRFIRANWGSILFLLILGTIYFSVEARTFLIRGLMRTGLFKADIKDNRIKLVNSKSWEVPSGITFTDAKGREVKLVDRRGKVMFINFWTTWCPPCRAEMPSINSLQGKLKNNKNVGFYMVDADSKTSTAVKFMNGKNYTLPVYSPSSYLPPEIFDGNLPTTLVVDREGRIVYHHIGAANYDDPDFLKFIEDLSR